MSWVGIWIHLVFSTKNREPLLDKTIRRAVFEHIKQNTTEKEIWLDINGYQEHAHCRISLSREQSVAKVGQLLKGESSFWINNTQGWCNKRFRWQDDYWAMGVSESHVPSVREYFRTRGTSSQEDLRRRN